VLDEIKQAANLPHTNSKQSSGKLEYLDTPRIPHARSSLLYLL